MEISKIIKSSYKVERSYFFWIVALVAISLIIHWRWLFLNILSNNDWQYISSELIASWSSIQYIGVWKSVNNIGGADSQPFFAVIRYAYSLFSGFEKSYEIGLFFIYLFPIVIIPPIATFLLLRNIFKDNIYSFLGGILLSFNTYFFVLQTAHLTIAIAYALVPLLLLTFINIFKRVNNRNISRIITFIIVASVAIILEPRIFYIEIIFFIPGLYLLRTYFKEYITIIFFIGVLNIFWMAPLMNMGTGQIGEIVNRSLFGNQFRSLMHAFTTVNPSWSWSEPTAFVLQSVSAQFWLLPIFAFVGLLFLKKQERYNKIIILFAYVVALVGIMLSKQSHPPFANFYLWLYEHFPGFNLYRESSKFFLLTVIAYSILVPFSIKEIVDFLREKNFVYVRFVKIFLMAIVLGICLLPSGSLVSGKIGTLFIPRVLPGDYIKFNNFIQSESEYFRVVGIPITERWVTATNNHPRVSQVVIRGVMYKALKDEKLRGINQEAITQLIAKNYASALYNTLGFKYFFVPIYDIHNGNDPFVAYGGKDISNIRQWYINELDKLNWLEKIDIGTKELVVYENKGYKPYIRSVDTLSQFENTKNLENKYSFVSDILHDDFDFVVEDEKKNIPDKKVDHIFENLNYDYLKDGVVGQSIRKTSQDNLYVNKGKKDLQLVLDNRQLVIKDILREHLFISSKDISSGGDILNRNNMVHTIDMDDNSQYYIQNGGDIFAVKNNVRLNENVPVKIYKSQNNNIISNPSLESGLWQNKVGDCNNHDDNSALDMKSSSNASEGNKSLELQAIRHTACTSQKNISVKSQQTYLFSFDYQSDDAKQGGFYVGFQGSKNNISSKLSIVDDKWRGYSQVVSIPNGVDKLSLYLYAYETDGEKNNIVRYDNFNLQKLELIKEVIPEEKTEFVKVDLPSVKGDQYDFEYRDEDYDYKNLISNASLENGLWSRRVGDCNNYDKKPILGIEHSDNASDGEKSLELQATRHIACTGTGIISVKGGTDYLLEFDYQSDNAKRAGVYIGFNDEVKSNINEKINVEDNEWHTFSKKITVPAGATTASLNVYSYSKDEKINIITRYDNFKLIELPNLDNRYYLVSEPEVELAKPNSVEFDLINPTKKLVHIKGATKPFYLTMSESYHDKWQAQLNNSKVHGFFGKWVPFVKPDVIANEQHFKYMTFLNGWYIDPVELCESGNEDSRLRGNDMRDGCTKNDDGSYDIEMVIEFTPQRWFYLGLLISGTTFVSLIGYLGYDFVRGRRRRGRGDSRFSVKL